jgi:hypothetical protein
MVPSIAILPPLFVGKASGEDTPMVFLEALTFGVVPATTAIASVPEVVKDGKSGMRVDAAYEKSPAFFAIRAAGSGYAACR